MYMYTFPVPLPAAEELPPGELASAVALPAGEELLELVLLAPAAAVLLPAVELAPEPPEAAGVVASPLYLHDPRDYGER
jgi:hypothetical protein